MIKTLDYIWSVLETWGGLEGRESKLEEGDGTFHIYVVGCWLEIVQTRSRQIADDDQGDDDNDLNRLLITMMAPQMEARGAVAEAEELRGRERRTTWSAGWTFPMPT